MNRVACVMPLFMDIANVSVSKLFGRCTCTFVNDLSMLPESLLCLLSATLAYSQITQNLTANNVTSFNTTSLPSKSSFSLPQSENLSITIALCSKSSSIPQFFVSNNSDSATLDDPKDTFSEIPFSTSGLGSWSGRFADGGVLAIESSNSDVTFDIGISDSGMYPLYRDGSHL